MKASDLINALQGIISANGDMDVVVCGLDGYGFNDAQVVEIASGYHTPGSIVCEYAPIRDSVGRNPGDIKRFIFVG